jgi:hypothetical protein
MDGWVDASALVWQVELGRVFRTDAFNLHAREYQPPRLIDVHKLHEIHAVKTQTEHRILKGKLLASFYERPPATHLQACRHLCCYSSVTLPKVFPRE